MKLKDKDTRDRLKAIRDALDTKRDEAKDLATAREEAKEAWKATFAGTPAGETVGTPEFDAAEAAVGAHGACEDEIADLQTEEKLILSTLGEANPDPRSGNGNGPSDIGSGRGWDAKALLQGEEYQSLRGSGVIDSRTKLGTVVLGQVADRETAGRMFSGQLLASEVTGDNMEGAKPADRRGIIPPNLQSLSILDLFPAGTTDATTVEYVQVLTIPDSAKEWTPGELKQEEEFTTRDADAPVRTIAGWIKIRRTALSDVAGLGSLINLLLPASVKRRLQRQILIGDGADQNLLGLYGQDDIGVPAPVDGDNPADAILRAATVIELSDAEPNFVALHPNTRQNLLLMRENEADRTGAYLYGTPSSMVAPVIWGLAMTTNRGVPEATPLVGDSMAAAVLYKEGVTIRISDSDGDDFRRNRVTVLAEVRVAFPVYRPTSFAEAPVPSGS